jgi:predicted amidohydrolase
MLAWKPKLALLLASAAVLFANLHYAAGPPRRLDWEGIDTLADDTPGAFGDFQRIESMLDRADSSPAKVIVFPEANIRSWTPTTLAFLDDRIRSLREKGKTVLTGALVPEPQGYRNVVEAFGSTTAVFEQRVPVPFGMWNPLSGRGVRLNLAGPSEIGISGERITILVCYEQLIAWPALVSTLDDPVAVVGIGSDYAIRGTPIIRVRAAYMRAWARLWSVPVVTATSI